jgi:hypothetical protein
MSVLQYLIGGLKAQVVGLVSKPRT